MKTPSILILTTLVTTTPLALAAPSEDGMAERGETMEMRGEMTRDRADAMEERSEAKSESGERLEERARQHEAMDEPGMQHVEQAADGAAHGMGMSRGEVARAAFATAVVDREPVDTLDKLPADRQKIYFFTELRGMAGQTATHRWEHAGRVQAEVQFEVKGPRWRVWSSKNLPPDATGEWKVSVINGNGEVISEEVVNITPPEAADLDTTGTVTQPAP